MSDDDLETLGQIADDLDNAIAMSRVPLPAGTHIAGLAGSAEKARDKLREFLRGKGFDPWGDDD